jgi:hypothetical protein
MGEHGQAESRAPSAGNGKATLTETRMAAL